MINDKRSGGLVVVQGCGSESQLKLRREEENAIILKMEQNDPFYGDRLGRRRNLDLPRNQQLPRH